MVLAADEAYAAVDAPRRRCISSGESSPRERFSGHVKNPLKVYCEQNGPTKREFGEAPSG